MYHSAKQLRKTIFQQQIFEMKLSLTSVYTQQKKLSNIKSVKKKKKKNTIFELNLNTNKFKYKHLDNFSHTMSQQGDKSTNQYGMLTRDRLQSFNN